MSVAHRVRRKTRNSLHLCCADAQVSLDERSLATHVLASRVPVISNNVHNNQYFNIEKDIDAGAPLDNT